MPFRKPEIVMQCSGVARHVMRKKKAQNAMMHPSAWVDCLLASFGRPDNDSPVVGDEDGNVLTERPFGGMRRE